MISWTLVVVGDLKLDFRRNTGQNDAGGAAFCRADQWFRLLNPIHWPTHTLHYKAASSSALQGTVTHQRTSIIINVDSLIPKAGRQVTSLWRADNSVPSKETSSALQFLLSLPLDTSKRPPVSSSIVPQDGCSCGFHCRHCCWHAARAFQRSVLCASFTLLLVLFADAIFTASDSDEPYLQTPNRGNKLKRKAKYISGGLDHGIGGPKPYRRVGYMCN